MPWGPNTVLRLIQTRETQDEILHLRAEITNLKAVVANLTTVVANLTMRP